MSFSSLSDILQPKKTQQDAAFQEVHDIFKSFKKIADETIPKNLHTLYSIGHLSEGTLFLEVEHATHAHALSLYKHTILRRMAMGHKKILISDIRITQKRKQP